MCRGPFGFAQGRLFAYLATSFREAATSLRMTLLCKDSAREDSLTLRQLSYCFGNLRQLGVDGAALQPQAVIDGWGATDHGSGGNVVGDAALGYGYGSVADFYVAADAYLSGQDYVVAYVGSAGEAYLGAEKRVVSDGAAVAYVDEVVDFCALSYAGLGYAGSVYAGVGLNLYVALYYYVAGLDDFVPAGGFAIFILGESEAVAAYYGSILEEDVVSYVAEFSNYGVGVGEEIVAYGCPSIDDYVGQEDGIVSDDNVFVDYYVGADVRVLA